MALISLRSPWPVKIRTSDRLLTLTAGWARCQSSVRLPSVGSYLGPELVSGGRNLISARQEPSVQIAGIPVLEVTAPDLESRRRHGKDDSIDAVAAERAALWGQRVQVAKDRDGAVEALRTRSGRPVVVPSRRVGPRYSFSTTSSSLLPMKSEIRFAT